MFMAWVDKNNATMVESLSLVLLVLVTVVVTAYGCFRLYDVPVRKWLTGKLLPSARR
jgi:peptidoglycan/LPS O-acetylase OafA/YrhL